MQSALEPLTFRLAQPGDFNEIVKLSEGIYDGHDYLPFTFHRWLQRDNLAVILAFSGDKLVGFLANFVVDDGRTCLHRAERILAELRGRGLVRQLREFARKYTREQFPSVQRERFVIRFDKVTRQNETKLIECDALSYQVTAKSFSRASTITSNAVMIEPCSKQHFSNIIVSPLVRAKLFPKNVVVVNSCPFEPLPSNAEHVLQECNEVFVEESTDDVLPRSISFGTLSPRVKYEHWRVFVYTDDPVLFAAHLVCQFKRAREVISGDFMFVCFQDKSFTQLARKVMEEQLQLKEWGAGFLDKTIRVYQEDLY